MLTNIHCSLWNIWFLNCSQLSLGAPTLIMIQVSVQYNKSFSASSISPQTESLPSCPRSCLTKRPNEGSLQWTQCPLLAFPPPPPTAQVRFILQGALRQTLKETDQTRAPCPLLAIFPSTAPPKKHNTNKISELI